MRKRSFTLLELILSITIMGICLIASIPLVDSYLKARKKLDLQVSAENTSAILESAFQELMRTVNIAKDKVAYVTPNGNTLIWKTTSGGWKRLKFNSGKNSIYYDARYQSGNPHYDPISDEPGDTAYTGDVFLSGVESVSFSLDTIGRVLLEVNKQYTAATGEAMIMTMRTGVRSLVADIPSKGRVDYWVDISPVVEGELLKLEEKDGFLYAVVKGNLVAIHTKAGFQDAQGEMFWIMIPAYLKNKLANYEGKTIVFNGDILPHKDNWYMRMNPSYGGGVILEAKEINEFHKRIEAGKETWYEESSQYLQPCFMRAKEKGVNIENWKELWKWMRYYYYKYMPALMKEKVE